MAFPFHTKGGRSYGGGTDPRIQYAAKGPPPCLTVVQPEEGRTIRVPHKAKALLDPLTFEIIQVRFSPFDVVGDYYGQPVVAQPGADYQPGIRVAVLLEGYSVPMLWLATSLIVMNKIKRLYERYEFATEAAQGLIPVYEYVGDERIALAKWPGEAFFAPQFEVVEWIERPLEVFGPARVALPLPILAASAPPISLPKSEPAAQPDNDNGGGAYRPVAASSDLLSKYIRRQH